MTVAELSGNTIETGDKLTVEFEAEIDQWEDGTMEPTAQRITDDGFCGTHVYLETESGDEFAYITPTETRGDIVAQIRKSGSNVVLATVTGIEVQ